MLFFQNLEKQLMTTKSQSAQAPDKNELVTAQEQTVLEQIARGDAPYSQRAMALLALNDGSTQDQAAEKTGLSAGQVKYWAAKFRKQRLDIFPNDSQDTQDTQDGKESQAEVVAESKPRTEKVDSAKMKSKDKKAKKGKKRKKKDKKSEKAKTGKKDKQNKKSKKTKKKSKKGKKSK
jgi:hypothetical protein